MAESQPTQRSGGYTPGASRARPPATPQDKPTTASRQGPVAQSMVNQLTNSNRPAVDLSADKRETPLPGG